MKSLHRQQKKWDLHRQLKPFFSDFSNGSAAKLKKLDVKSMTAKQYMDEMVVPTLLKALSVVNQKV